ncbi:hypothetical protein EDB81DRAFT_848325 [Dactylonectria macrodidyma]|uniref:DUF7587 domain-containing protein n=1 Tax=Dactylonectria macrodidyma TaxID=307937 RepID=A0A9P9ICZ9_9HYPO|nr:hypothetical protein EDB81DRAFT_848325 [Dactylonectria macrodidyma]
MSTLTATFQNLSLGDPSFLTFNPIGENVWIRANFEHIPRYLIRIFTPQSAGSTDEFWAKSRDARYGNEFTAVDIFMRDNDHVANMLNTHLRWKGKNGKPDNLTSWTSSWLFALQDASSFDAIKCCIIDTTLFPKGCFVRDTDLIRAYEQSNSDLHSFGNLRSRRYKTYTGSFYFGEYLSQGALKIREKCKIVSAKDMIDRGLFILQPLLQEFENWELMERPPWANEVIRLREAFYNEELEIEQATDAQIQASIDIADSDLVGLDWTGFRGRIQIIQYITQHIQFLGIFVRRLLWDYDNTVFSRYGSVMQP